MTGCAFKPVRIEPGETATYDGLLKPLTNQTIEIELSGLGSDEAQLALSGGLVELLPIYVAVKEHSPSESDGEIQTRLWSSLWPLPDGEGFRVVNRGSSPVTVERIRVRRGLFSNLARQAAGLLPIPDLGWVDLKEIMERKQTEAQGPSEQARKEIYSLEAWTVQRNRRAAFETIHGLPLPARLGRPLEGDVEVRVCQLGGRGAVVAFSRRDPTAWRPVGPAWMPATGQERWMPVPADRTMPRGFESKGAIRALAFYAGAPDSAVGTASSLSAKLYGIDTPTPLSAVEWKQVRREGQWLEMAFEPPLAKGTYLLELRSASGSPAWLGWREDAAPAASEFGAAPGALVLHEVAEGAPSRESIRASVRVVGWAKPIERFAGSDSNAQFYEPRVSDAEMLFECDLRPGETEIFYLRDYKSRGITK